MSESRGPHDHFDEPPFDCAGALASIDPLYGLTGEARAAKLAELDAKHAAWKREDERRELESFGEPHGWDTAVNRYLDESKARNP